MKARTFHFSSRRAFTLVELLTAIAVLGILMVIIGSILGSTSQVADTTGRTSDSAIEARQVLDRIGADINGMLIRPDVDMLFYNGTGNDAMFFYSQVAGYFDPNVTPPAEQGPLALVGYRINPAGSLGSEPALERLAMGMAWDNTGDSNVPVLPYLSFTPRPPTTNTTGPIPNTALAASTLDGTGSGSSNVLISKTVGNPPYTDGTSSFYDAIGSQVFRLEICYQKTDGTFTLTPAPRPLTAGTLTSTSAIVVAIAVLDSRSRKLITAPGQWTSLIGALPDPTASDLTGSQPKLMDSIWNTQIQSPAFAAAAGIPAAAAAHIRVYQRIYYLNAPKFQ